MNGRRFSENKARKNGFYLALAVCLVAVGIAAWSTYDAVHNYLAPEAGKASSGSVQSQAPKSQSGKTVSRIKDDPEAPSSSASSAPARQTVGAVTGKEESSKINSSEAEQPVSSVPEEPVSSEPQIPVNAPIYEISDELIHPLQSKEIHKAYSAGAPVYSETMKDWRIHTGMDEKAESGEEVYACGNGQVKRTYTDRMLGNVIEIEHGEYEFFYCGLGENFLVKEGDTVTKGQAIGTVTAVPFEAAEGVHLHLEVRRDGIYVDPESILAGQE